MIRFFQYLFSLLFITACLFSCQEPKPPNILWISAEDISPAWGCYGDDYAFTPHIDQLAEGSYIFTQAFSNAPICAPARSTLISGMYATSLGTQHLRSEIPVSQSLRILPELMREEGYFTTNNAKTDYNFSAEGRWDENGNEAHWRNKKQDQPFFSVFNFGITHEGNANTDNVEDTQSLAQKHDPERAQLPPYYPKSDEFKRIWAHQYDLISVFDQEVGKLIDQLKEDGEYENTIIFVFADHGYGLPHYKRWLYNSGLQVPFVLHVPEQYKDLVSNLSPQRVDQMVSFVDFAPTVLKLAGAEVPQAMEGQNFLGEEVQPKKNIYGYRDRADDCYDMARSIYDGRYIYIRHFMPHKPYIQNAVIFNRGKRSFEELLRVKAENGLPPEAEDMFKSKPVEELYDLQNDPYEMHNLIAEQDQKRRVQEMQQKLYAWMLKHHDTGLLNEGEMMLRAEASGSVYEMARDSSSFDVKHILEAAALVGEISDTRELTPFLNAEDSGVRYWALVALDAYPGEIASQYNILSNLIHDASPTVAILSSEILIKRIEDEAAYNVLSRMLNDEREAIVLQAAISVRNLGSKANPLLEQIENEIMPKYAGDIWGKYKSWSYPMFIGMALDQTMENCGREVFINN